MSLNEGNAGTTVVHLYRQSFGARSTGGVTFDIATPRTRRRMALANGEDNDYVPTHAYIADDSGRKLELHFRRHGKWRHDDRAERNLLR